jgi:hypothetical protein
MASRSSRARSGLVLAFAAAAIAGSCAPMGGLGDILVPGSNSLNGEVRSIDTRRNRIDVRQDHGGDRRVRYDNRTRLFEGQRQYPVSALSRGDRVRIQLSHDRNGTLWADRIDVRSTARGRATTSNRIERVDGVVRVVDNRRGYFTLERNRTTVVVHVPSRVSSSDRRRFDRLRRNERVRADVRWVGRSNQAELVRFR